MTRSLTLLSVLWLAPLVALAGCAPEVRVDDAALRAARPTSLAVLPFEVAVATPSPRAAAQVEAVRVAVHGRLAGKAWLHLELDEVDRRLARAGLDRARAATASTQLLARLLDVDAVVRGRITGLAHLQGGVVFRQAIEGELRLVDARQGVELARVQHTESSAGGLLLLLPLGLLAGNFLLALLRLARLISLALLLRLALLIGLLLLLLALAILPGGRLALLGLTGLILLRPLLLRLALLVGLLLLLLLALAILGRGSLALLGLARLGLSLLLRLPLGGCAPAAAAATGR